MLGKETLKLLSMKMLKSKSSVKKSMGIFCDVVVNMASFMFPTNFMILYSEVDFHSPIILGRLFQSIESALIDMELEQMTFRLNNEQVVLYVF